MVPSQLHKKTPKPDKREQDITTTSKRNASTRSPLEENPEKRQRCSYKQEHNGKIETNAWENMSQANISGNTIEPDNSNEYSQSPEEIEHNPTDHSNLNTGTDNIHYHNTLESLLQELKDLKGTILKLDAKIDHGYQDLSSKLANTEKLKDLIASQSDQIRTLYIENNSLKLQNEILEKDLLEVQESMLKLKVDVTGIPESSCETYDQLCTKIAKIIIPTCKGMTEEVKWIQVSTYHYQIVKD